MIKAFHMLVSYGVQKSSQQSAVHSAWPGPKAYLTFEKERELTGFLMHTADIGFLHVTGTKKYHYNNAVPLAVIRTKATDRESFMMYFEILEDTWCSFKLQMY